MVFLSYVVYLKLPVYHICFYTSFVVYSTSTRYIVVKKRDRQTYHKIIQNEIDIGTKIHIDEWLAYKKLEIKGYIHKTVNHSQFFVDLTSDLHKHCIEIIWGGGLKLQVHHYYCCPRI